MCRGHTLNHSIIIYGVEVLVFKKFVNCKPNVICAVTPHNVAGLPQLKH